MTSATTINKCNKIKTHHATKQIFTGEPKLINPLASTAVKAKKNLIVLLFIQKLLNLGVIASDGYIVFVKTMKLKPIS